MSGILNLPGLRELDKKESVSMGRMTYFMMGSFDDDYEVKIKTRMGNVGTDLPTLLALLDSDDF